jgi:putative DNA primase/helicase
VVVDESEFDAGDDEPDAPPTKPTIKLRQGDIPALVDEAGRALASAKLKLYQRAGGVVQVGVVTEPARGDRPRTISRLHPVNDRLLVEHMARSADWEKWVAKTEKWLKTDPPMAIAQHFLARGGIGSHLPLLVGIVHTATLRGDGSLLDKPGYDKRTGLYLDLRGERAPIVPGTPTQQDARDALNTLLDLVSECPFDGDASKAVAISAMLTALIRPALPAAPAHAITATTYGSRKSYLTDLIATIATGDTVAPITAAQGDEELEKRLAAELIAGKGFVVIDNVDREIGGALLAQSITQPKVNPRRLGKSENVEIINAVFQIWNGNNIAAAADMARRVVVCSLDAKVERPELRSFYKDPLAMVHQNRGMYVGAALTILRAYRVAGMPNRPKRIGSFEVWSDWVRGALLWCDMADPAASMDAVRDTDPEHQRLVAVMAQWDQHIGNERVTTRQIIGAATLPTAGDFREALLAIAGDRGAINSHRLGKWLHGNKGRIAGGMALHRAGVRAGSPTWFLNGGRAAGADEAAKRAWAEG